MVICLESSILGGYLSNEVPGLVTGMLHLAGQKRPVRVELSGNFLRDIAGCRVEFQNPLPECDIEDTQQLSHQQNGQVGVMTASYRVAKLPRRRHFGTPGFTLPEPPGLKNLLFFEWFNQDHQRILIQSWHLQTRVSPPRWQLSKEAETAQLRQNRAKRRDFLLRSRRGKSAASEALAAPSAGDPFEPGDATTDPFAALDEAPAKPARKGRPKGDSQPPDPAQRSSALADELRRFENLLTTNAEVASRPALLRLLSTVGDLSAHLGHALKQFSPTDSDQWEFLVVDLEQSLPLFGAALNACEKLMQSAPIGTDAQWLSSVQSSLLNIELRMRELLALLR